jgi:hypothetical protein
MVERHVQFRMPRNRLHYSRVFALIFEKCGEAVSPEVVESKPHCSVTIGVYRGSSSFRTVRKIHADSRGAVGRRALNSHPYSVSGHSRGTHPDRPGISLAALRTLPFS